MSSIDFHQELYEELAPQPGFFQALAEELVNGAYGYVGRRNELRFGPSGLSAEQLEPLEKLAGMGFVSRGGASPNGLAEILRNLDVYERGWELFTDERSKTVYLRVLALRAFGEGHVAMPLEAESFWSDYDYAMSQEASGESAPGGMGFTLQLYDLKPFGLDLKLRCRAGTILEYCLQKQYQLHGPEGSIAVEPGDIVIDGGAAWGDTSLIFASQVGRDGLVIACECVEGNIKILEENRSLNPSVSERVKVANYALWDKSGERLLFADSGPGSRALGVDGDIPSTAGSGHLTITIDDLVKEFDLPKVDFIKLDVEGSEHAVLEGARDTLERFRPKLALSAYHRLTDISVLPHYINDLGLGYRLFLDHYTNHREETVLYAMPPG